MGVSEAARDGDEVAEFARRDYGGDEVTEDGVGEGVFADFVPQVPSAEEPADGSATRL